MTSSLPICDPILRKSDHPKCDTVRVIPNEKNPTDPKGLYELSNLDQIVAMPVEFLFAFQTNSSLINVDVGEILKQSLRKALEVYYPLAGRLKAVDGKMVVDCDVDGGVPFSEEDMAAAVGDITMIDGKLAEKLVYNNQPPFENALDVLPLAIQVNRFRCGGVVLGLTFNHAMLDGMGTTNFMISWSEIARDLPSSIKPHLDRSILSPRKPPKIYFRHPEFTKLEIPFVLPFPSIKLREKTVKKSFIFTPEMFFRLRELAMQHNNNKNNNEHVSRAPTNFELVMALAWICWTKAQKLGPNETTRISPPVDCRNKLQPPMPKRYFGNCIVLPCAQSTAREITSMPLSYAVGTVHDAIKLVTGDYIRSTLDFL